VHRCAFQTRSEAYGAISDIENYYNAKRRHSAAGNESPVNFELASSGRTCGIVTSTICTENPGNSKRSSPASIGVERFDVLRTLESEGRT